MEIYLDANATTPVLPEARSAALEAMADAFGNPSSVHGTGLKARALMDRVRACARRVLDAPRGELLFVSGATEGIQTAVLSALSALRERRAAGTWVPQLLLYGATEHKAVPEAIRHWNTLLGLGMQVSAIPVGRDGRHDLSWLRERAPRAGLVCTMAANNETGVISDLDGIADAIRESGALWMVDSVQALGKLPLRLSERPIDYAPFSGHKLYAPKGIGLLYVREGAPVTPLLAGGGQEGALRSGTENMPGIAALGAVLAALEAGRSFHGDAVLEGYRRQLGQALEEAFPGLVFNAPAALSLATTLNFAVPGLGSKLLLDLFDAAEMRVSGGSACSAARAQPSYVLEAMGLPAWQAASAVRLSFGPATAASEIDEACRRIAACGDSLRESCLGAAAPVHATPHGRITRFVVDGECCWVVADASTRRCVVIDPLPELSARLVHWMACSGYRLVAALQTDGGPESAAAAELCAAVSPAHGEPGTAQRFGWPAGPDTLSMGALRLSRHGGAGDGRGATAYLLHEGDVQCAAFVGKALSADAAPRWLCSLVGTDTLLLPSHDPHNRMASTLASFAASDFDDPVELEPVAAMALAGAHLPLHLVDVREPYEQRLGGAPVLGASLARQTVALSGLVNALPTWLALPAEAPVLFFCRSGVRSAQAARALRRLGHAQAWSLAGGVALWPGDLTESASAAFA